MKILSSIQFTFISIFLLLSTKVFTITPFVFGYAGKDSIWSMSFGALIDFVILFLVIIIMQKNKGITFFELLKKCFGTIIAKILLGLLFVFILLKALFLYQETHSFFLQILFDEFPLLLYVVPVLFITGYFAVKGIDTIARSIEIFAIFVLIGVTICAATAINGANFNYLLPFFENGIGPSLDGLWAQMFYRGNPIILLCFMGKVEFKKYFNIKFMIANGILLIMLLATALLFYMVYGPSARYVEFALADLPQYDPFVSDLGRFNWLSVVVCTIALFLTSSIFLYCMALIGRWIFGLKRSIIPVGISLTMVIILALMHQFSLPLMMVSVANEWLWINASVLFLYVLLCLGLLIFRRKKWIKH